MLVSFNYMPTDMTIAVSSYLLSQFLDAFDGHAARALQQCKFFLVLYMWQGTHQHSHYFFILSTTCNLFRINKKLKEKFLQKIKQLKDPVSFCTLLTQLFYHKFFPAV